MSATRERADSVRNRAVAGRASGRVQQCDWSGTSIAGPSGPNEDAWGYGERVWAVADGIGSMERGADCAALAVAEFVAQAPVTVAGEMASLVRDIGQQIADETGGFGGTTLTGLVLREEVAVVVHAGDTRAYLSLGGVLRCITRDHNVREFAMAAGIEPAAFASGEEEALTSFVGMVDQVADVCVSAFPVNPGTRLAVVSDGVWKAVQAAEIADVLADHDVEASAHSLVDAARQNHTGDDATAVVIGVSS